jgi:predicted DNA-binding WGR domain protein
MTGELFHIELQARDPSRNCWRFYRIEAGRDLFGDLVVRFHYGRIGGKGQTRTHTAPDAEAAAQLVRACLKRRQSSPKRVGVAYGVKEKFDPDNWTNI